MTINAHKPTHGYQRPIKGGSFQRKQVQKICQEKLSRKISRTLATKLFYEETLLQQKLYKVIEAPWGATPPRSPLLYPTWPRRGSSARLLGFLLDIGPPLGLYPLKNRG